MAAVRVFLFCAAFPFFNNVDERRHFDLVIKYASGRPPRGAELISPAALPYLSRYASPEFLASPESFEGGYYGPMWRHSPEEIAPALAAIEEIWSHTRNQECSQPPLYYLAAAVWFNLGQWIGLKDGSLLYWIRFLNVVLIALMVWLAYAAGRIVFPDRIAMRVAIPLFVAVIPQDAFYGIENDVLSPICFGITFICLIRWFREDQPCISLGIATRVLNCCCLPYQAEQFTAHFGRSGRNRLLLLCTNSISKDTPLHTCVERARRLRGDPNRGLDDLDESQFQAQLLGWTAKPFRDWWSHPIFTPSGFWTFLSELIASFWRGEFMWHAHTLGSKGMDLFYIFSSLGFLLVAVVSLLRNRTKNAGGGQRSAYWIAAASFIAVIIFLGFLSLQFDFGSCINPSRERPYFFQGRLGIGAMIPFALLYLYGLDRVFYRWPPFELVSVFVDVR